MIDDDLGNLTPLGDRTHLPDEPRDPHLDRIRAVLARITYKPGYRIRVARTGGRPWLQIVAHLLDAAGDPTFAVAQHGGKVWLSDHMVDGEIVQAAFGAFRAFEEHECREWFLYRGRRIFGPHINPEALLAVCDDTVGRAA